MIEDYILRSPLALQAPLIAIEEDREDEDVGERGQWRDQSGRRRYARQQS